MKTLNILIALFISTSLLAQEKDSIKSTALQISFSSLHSSAPDNGPDTLRITYNDAEKETEKILISKVTERAIGVPIIMRSQYDSLDRLTATQWYAFGIDNVGKELSLKDTAHVVMDSFISKYTYVDNTVTSVMDWNWSGDFEQDSKSYHFQKMDSLDRVVYEYEENENKLKVSETWRTFTDSFDIHHSIHRHDDGRVYSDVLDSTFYDKNHEVIRKKFFDEDAELKYHTWSKCGTCSHYYKRNDDNKIVQEIWESNKGEKLMQIDYVYLKDKIIGKRKRHLVKDKERSEWYEYDGQGNVIKYEYFKRGNLERWDKMIFSYKENPNK